MTNPLPTIEDLQRIKRVRLVRESIQTLTKMIAKKGVNVVCSGSQPYVKYSEKTLQPQFINIPMIPDNASKELLDCVQGFVDHEAAHVLYTDAGTLIAGHEEKITSIANIFEDIFIESRLVKSLPGSKGNLQNSCKWVAQKCEEGAEKSAHGLSGEELDRAVIMSTMVCFFRYHSGQTVFEDIVKKYAAHYGDFEELCREDGILDEVQNIKDSWHALDLARRLKQVILAMWPSMQSGQNDGSGDASGDPSVSEEGESGESGDCESSNSSSSSDGEPSEEGDGESSEEGDGDSEGDSDEEGESGDGEEGDGDSDEEGGKAKPTQDNRDEGLDPSSQMADESEGGDEESESESDDEAAASNGDSMTGEKGKAEWDAEPDIMGTEDAMEQVINKEMDKVDVDLLQYSDFFNTVGHPLKEEDGMTGVIQKVEERVGEIAGAISSQLYRVIQAQNVSRWAGAQRKGRIDPKNLYRLRMNDDRVFRKRELQRSKNTAVSLVIDCSGSMGGMVNAQGETALQHAAMTAWALSHCLDRLSIPTEVIGFTTAGPMHKAHVTDMATDEYISYREQAQRIQEEFCEGQMKNPDFPYNALDCVYMPLAKAFDEKFGPTVKNRMAQFANCDIQMGGNADGTSVRYAANRLAKRKEERKIMIVLSDGMPAASGSSGTQEEHLKRVTKEIAIEGIELMGIGLNSNAVQQFYENSTVLSDVSQLSKEVLSEMVRILSKN